MTNENFNTKQRFIDLRDAGLTNRKAFANRIGVHLEMFDEWLNNDFMITPDSHSLKRNLDLINKTIVEIEKENGIHK